ncbi:MAG: ATP-binding cassette domain-containing protein [Fusobacterium sp.]|nr:ATP-binding cassette domain-containing protein [Fusobacterium sp.]
MIKVENLNFSYKNQKILKNLSFSIKKGSYVCIIGENGSGKSTLAKLMTALIPIKDGKIKILGYDVGNAENLLNIRKNIGIVFQNPEAQLISTKVFDEVIFGLENIACPREKIKEYTEEALGKVNLLKYKDKLISELSGGEKQRLAIASILAMNPDILIFDEATSMLDPKNKKEILKIIKELNVSGKTIIHITHDRENLFEADDIIVLSKGELKYQGSPYKLFSEDENFVPFILKVKNILKKYEIKIDEKNINMEELVRIVYENIT